MSDTFSGIWSRFAENSLFMQERERMIVHFALKCSCLISTTCQMVVNCINHVPNSHSSLTFKGNYSEHSLPEVSQTFPPSSYFGCSDVDRPFILLILTWMLFTGNLTSSLWSSRWTSQVTVACGERGTHSRKVLLFSVPKTTLSSVTSRSSFF